VEPADDGAWEDAAAADYLCDAERDAWRRMRLVPSRRGRWLRGRIAAKHAVYHLLRGHSGLSLPMSMITVLPHSRGRPVVHLSAALNGTDPPVVSISHHGKISVALAAGRADWVTPGVGIDIASPAEDHEGLAEGGFAEVETALLDGLSSAERGGWLLRMWCAKEAVGKALEWGLMGNPLRLQVRRIDTHGHRVEIAVVGPPPGPPWPVGRDQSLVARVGQSRGLVFAVAGFGDAI
jgi:phosphopantetheinyl transferase